MGSAPAMGSAAAAAVDAPMDPSVEALKARVALNPDNVNLRLDLGDAYLKTMSGSFEAFEESKAVLAKDPTNPRALIQQAAVRNMMGQYPAAIELTEHALVKNPVLINGWLVRGRAALALGRGQTAIESFQKAIELDPSLASQLESSMQAARSGSAAPEATGGPAAGAAPAAPRPRAPLGPAGRREARLPAVSRARSTSTPPPPPSSRPEDSSSSWPARTAAAPGRLQPSASPRSFRSPSS